MREGQQFSTAALQPYKCHPLRFPDLHADCDVLLVYVGPPAVAPACLVPFLARRVAVTWIDPTEIDLSHSWTRLWITMYRDALGWAPAFEVPEGFYLFRDGIPQSHAPAKVAPRHRSDRLVAATFAAIADLLQAAGDEDARILPHAPDLHRLRAWFDDLTKAR